jgi:hypothetical protein|nr:MAG TPA: hypothetical protein [Caudoviricetes sp.]
MKFSCHGCTERTPTCHCTCEKYIEESKQNEIERNARRNSVDAYTINTITKQKDYAAKARLRHPLSPGCIR